MRKGRRVALDPGSRRIGVAVSDADGLVASERAAISVGSETEFAELIFEVQPSEIIVGLPKSLDGNEGPTSRKAREFAEWVLRRAKCPVRLVDERFSTVEAQRGFHDQGLSIRQSRVMIDSAAATLIAERWLARN